MQITVKLFAALRERAGTRERSVDLPDGASVGDVWPVLELGDEPPGLAYARNREYAERDVSLADGDEVAVIPPVSGGSFRVVGGPLDLAALVAEVSDPGMRRDRHVHGDDPGRQSRPRRHPPRVRRVPGDGRAGDAADRRRPARASRRSPRVAMVHRTGPVPIGEASVMIAVSAPHRGPALAACQEAIDTLKLTVPVWKKEIFEGGEEWIGMEGTG